MSKTHYLFKARRFRRENINPLFQHYKICSNWIDLVDNLFIAIWFSNNNCEDKCSYIKFVAQKTDAGELKISDLRERHSSLSLRLHCQHAISATKNIKKWNLKNINFNDYLIATVKIPNNKEFNLNNRIFSNEFMFPTSKIDNTLKLLKNKKFKELYDEIIKKYDLGPNELGKIE